MTQPRFDLAREEADRVDASRRRGEPLGLLAGVPVTIKDCFAVDGAKTTLGIPGYAKGDDTEDAPLVQRLRAAGAIVLGKTNVPEGMLLHECDNPLFGKTLHPTHPQRSPGGSSGGEAALVALGGSALGLASDLGGSIRHPAVSCGVCGFKPGGGRLSVVGSRRAISGGMRALAIQPGPIVRSVSDADLAMRVLLDPTASPRQSDEKGEPWPDYRETDVSKLRIAYWADDGVLPVAVAVRRAVEESVEVLRAVGAQVERTPPPDIERMMRIYFGLIAADGMLSMDRLLQGSEVNWQLARQVRLGKTPRLLRSLLATLAAIVGQPLSAKLLRWTGPRTADEYWRFIVEADEYRTRFWRQLDQAMGGPGADALLTPPHSLPALKHGTSLHLLTAASHCYLANLLDAPSGVVPVTTVMPEDERAELASERSRWRLTSRLATANAKESEGLPLGVQVTAKPGRDDVALAVMAAIESGLKR